MRLVLVGFLVAGCSKTDTGVPGDSGPGVASPVAPASASASPVASASAALGVGVTNIGVHIGGGPNDNATKAPVRDAIAPHFDAFARCYESVETRKSGDVGVDLLIEAEGGAAKVSNPRVLGLRGEAFKRCVVEEFGKVRFQKMRHGKTMASYSLRFVPKESPPPNHEKP